MQALAEGVRFIREEHGFPKRLKPYWTPFDHEVTTLGIVDFEVDCKDHGLVEPVRAEVIYVEGVEPKGTCRERPLGGVQTVYVNPDYLTERLRPYF